MVLLVCDSCVPFSAVWDRARIFAILEAVLFMRGGSSRPSWARGVL